MGLEVFSSVAEKFDNSQPRIKTASRWVLACVAMTLIGILLGLAVMGIFDTAYAVIRFVWITAANLFDTPIYPVIISTLVGIALMLIVMRYGKAVRPMDAVENTAKKAEDDVEGKSAASASQKRLKRPLPVRVADFLLPFAGGAPVGVAMGLMGFIASGCSWAKKTLLRFCRSLDLLDANTDFSKAQKIVLYTMGITGGFIGASIIVDLLGLGMVIPRVDAAPFSLEAVGIGALIAVLGWLLGLAYLMCARLAHMLWQRAGRFQSVLPAFCGIALGVAMTFLPHVGLPGSDVLSFQLLGEWQDVSPAALITTAIVRAILIAFLLNLGWSGGPFLPLVYCAICLGLGISGAFGVDMGVSTAAAVSAILVAFTGRPLTGIAAFMCCPFESLPVIAVSTLVASIIPRPKSFKGEFPRMKRKN